MSNLFDSDFRNIKLFAHSKAQSKTNFQKELFYEHCDRTIKYYDKIVKQFELIEIFEQIIKDIDPNLEIKKIVEYLKKFIFFHDIGKLTDELQRKLEGEKNKETHSDKSFFVMVYELIDQLKQKKISTKEYFIHMILIYAVYKHHGSLDNILKDLSKIKFFSQKAKIVEIFKYLNLPIKDDIIITMENEKFWQRWNQKENKELFLKISKDSLSFFILIKLYYSLLITSDYYATMEFMEDKEFEIHTFKDDLIYDVKSKFQQQTIVNKKHNFNPEINKNQEYLRNLDITKLKSESQDDKKEKLNILRSKLNIEAEKNLETFLKSDPENNVYFLNVPTGGGKTNISLRLALKIMEHKKIKKMCYVFPFINIIEQSFENLKGYFGIENIARLDSRFIDPNMDEEYRQNKVFSNYVDQLFFNSPLLFLSHVKFFDLFFRNNKNSNYNFFQLANSIVIIDEIQAYQDEIWTEISYVLKSFGKLMNTHFIVMSATLPELGKLADVPFNYLFDHNFSKIVYEHQLFKRTEIKPINTSKEKLLKEIKKQKDQNKILVVFNKVKDSYEFFSKIEKEKIFENHKLLLLNSTILEARRKEILNLCQDEEQKIILISTQSIEAGVDIDFDVGFRAYAPWDSIIQVAGRINRNNKKPVSSLFVFKDEHYKDVYRDGYKIKITDDNISDFFKSEIKNENELIFEFYTKTLNQIREDNQNPFMKNSAGNISDIRNLFLKIIDEEIHLIKGDTISLYIPINEQAEKLWFEYRELFNSSENNFFNLILIKEFRKQLLPYSLNIFNLYTQNGKLSSILKDEIQYGYYYCENWSEFYCVEKGLNSDKFKKAIQSREILFI